MTRTTLLIYLFLTLACGCSDIIDSEHVGMTDALCFSADITTKGMELANSNMDNFGIFAFYTGTDNWFAAQNSATPQYLYNKTVTRTQSGGQWSAWSYDPVMYWPKQGEKLSFFAYAPAATAQNNITVSPVTQTGMPTLVYQVSTDIKQQQDLLYSLPLLDKQKDAFTNGKVTLAFKHALTKVQFRAKFTPGGEPAAGQYVQINSISLTSINNKASFTCATEPVMAGIWNLQSTQSNYTVSIAGNELGNIALSSQYKPLTTGEGTMFLLPQTFGYQSEITVVYTLYESNGTPVEEFLTSMPLSFILNGFIMGNGVIFNIQVGVEQPAIIYAETCPWDMVDVDGYFTTTYLNISRSNITEYRGQPITIYYQTDYNYHLILTCIEKPYYAGEIVIHPENGKIEFPTNLVPGNYKFRLRAGTFYRIIYLNIY
ncbi:MAG: fimbrillin family protein [Marinifilaceae bacterium]